MEQEKDVTEVKGINREGVEELPQRRKDDRGRVNSGIMEGEERTRWGGTE